MFLALHAPSSREHLANASDSEHEFSATHAWTLGKREPKAKRAPSEQATVYGFERQSEELRVESGDKRRGRVTSLFTLHTPLFLACTLFARALND